MIPSSGQRRADMHAKGLWPDLTFDQVLRRIVTDNPNREAIVDPPNRLQILGSPARRLTWAEFGQAVDALAGQLSVNGLRKGDVVVVQLANSWELFALYFACFRLGIVVSPVAAQYRDHELAYVVQHTGARALATNTRIGSHEHGGMADRLRQQCASLSTLLVLGPAADIPPGALDLAAMLAAPPAASAVPHAEVGPDDMATIVWTSGSEGHPKGIHRSHAMWLVQLDTLAQAFHLPIGARLLTGRPLVNHGAMIGTLLPWLGRAGTVVLHHPFSLEIYAQQLRDERIDFTSMAPAILTSLVNQPGLFDGVDFARLRTVSSGSAPLSPTLVEEFERRFKVRVVNLYGSSEGASLGSSPDDIPDPALRARFFPRMGVAGYDWSYPTAHLQETRLVDLDSEQEIVTAGQPGELRVRGPLVFDGYFNDPEATRAAFDDQGFYRTGDLFELAGERLEYYRFAGRSKDIIVRGGFNISALEVENLVAAHPGVREVAVVGSPDSRLGERVCAVIAMRDGHSELTLEALIDFLRNEQRVATLKLPEKLVVLQALPRTANTKVDKRRLRDLLFGSQASAHAGQTDQSDR